MVALRNNVSQVTAQPRPQFCLRESEPMDMERLEISLEIKCRRSQGPNEKTDSTENLEVLRVRGIL